MDEKQMPVGDAPMGDEQKKPVEGEMPADSGVAPAEEVQM